MKKKALITALGTMVNMGVFAQGQPVMDITNIIASIQNGYTMVQQLQSMYENIQTSYKQLQEQIKSFESFDFKSLDIKDPLGSWRSINTYADRMMTYEENIEAILTRKDIKIGNGSYSLTDIFTTPPDKTIQNMAADGVTFVVDPLEAKLSDHEKAVFHQKYGMSYGHYMRFNTLGGMLKDKAAEVVGYTKNLQENLSEDRERLDHITKDVFESESMIQQQQMNNAMISIMAQDTKTQAELLAKIAQQLAVMETQAQIEKQARLDEKNMNDLNLSDGFLQMLDDIPSSYNYR